MRKISLFSAALMAAIGCATHANAQILTTETQNVTVTMDLQPVFQLDLVGNDEVDFTFSQMINYVNGIERLNATRLRVGSTVEWNLNVVPVNNTGLWTIEGSNSYGSGGTNSTGDGTTSIPVTALQLRVTPTAVINGINNFSEYQSLSNIAALGTYEDCFNGEDATVFGTSIAGDAAHTAGAGITPELPGDYHHFTGGAGTSTTAYEFTVDYKIRPNVPSNFQTIGCGTNSNVTHGTTHTAAAAATALGTILNPNQYALPGYYTCGVEYVLSQD